MAKNKPTSYMELLLAQKRSGANSIEVKTSRASAVPSGRHITLSPNTSPTRRAAVATLRSPGLTIRIVCTHMSEEIDDGVKLLSFKMFDERNARFDVSRVAPAAEVSTHG